MHLEAVNRTNVQLSQRCDKMAAMTDAPDFRADKSESVEGAGKAADRWFAYIDTLDEDVLAEAFPMSVVDVDDYPDFVRDDIAADAMEQSELIGFWVAWHLAGGFLALEEGGWHRATIFRKIRRFRSRYGVHPDEYSFPWIRLEPEKAWASTIAGRIENRPPGFFH
jgi:hypothetical protein